MALYSVRSERQFRERLKYDVLDMNLEEAEDPCLDASVFTKNQERFVGPDISGEFFAGMVVWPRSTGGSATSTSAWMER